MRYPTSRRKKWDDWAKIFGRKVELTFEDGKLFSRMEKQKPSNILTAIHIFLIKCWNQVVRSKPHLNFTDGIILRGRLQIFWFLAVYRQSSFGKFLCQFFLSPFYTLKMAKLFLPGFIITPPFTKYLLPSMDTLRWSLQLFPMFIIFFQLNLSRF